MEIHIVIKQISTQPPIVKSIFKLQVSCKLFLTSFSILSLVLGTANLILS